METERLILSHEFTLDCWDCIEDAAGRHYSLDLSASGLLRRPRYTYGTTQSLVKGVVLLRPDETFKIEENLWFPAGITVDEARVIVLAMFENLGRGRRYDGDWCWWPIELEEFLSRCASVERARTIGQILRQCVDQINVIEMV